MAIEKRRLEAEQNLLDESPSARTERVDKILFMIADDALDTARGHPHWLDNLKVAQAIQENLFFHANRAYRLYSFVIMPNHVHVLLEPISAAGQTKDQDGASMPQIIHLLKSFTAHQANEILGRNGAFWEAATFHQWIRDGDEFFRTVDYIERNPIKARLVNSPLKWPWSSAALARAANGTCINKVNKLG